MSNYQFVDLKEVPLMKDGAAEWFHSKWNVPKEAYLECMEAYLSGEIDYGWYLCLDGDKIIAGLGVIENDFHDRKDLTPNVCAVYTEEEYRNQIQREKRNAEESIDIAKQILSGKSYPDLY